MAEPTVGNNVRLGLFVAVGLSCLMVVLYLLGRQQRLFSSSLPVQADFRNVSGLIPGNNVRLGGINVGTVKAIRLLNDTTVRVLMNLDRDVQPLVHRNTVATIGTDGLVGNTIINLTASAAAAPLVAANDVLPTRTLVSIDALLGTLDLSNKNLVGITQDLHEITGKLNGSDALWKLLSDEQLTADVRRTVRNAATATAQLTSAAADVQHLTHGARQGRGLAGYLLTDNTMARQLGHAGRQLAGTSDTLAATLSGLRRQVNTGAGPLHVLLADTASAQQLRRTLNHVEQGTAGFNQNMEALQHNFLLRGYFRRQARKKARASGQ